MGQKCEQIERKKRGRQMVVPMTKIMFQRVTLIFEPIDGFIFDFPPCATQMTSRGDVLRSQPMVGHPGVEKKRLPTLGIGDLQLTPVDEERIFAGTERELAGPAIGPKRMAPAIPMANLPS